MPVEDQAVNSTHFIACTEPRVDLIVRAMVKQRSAQSVNNQSSRVLALDRDISATVQIAIDGAGEISLKGQALVLLIGARIGLAKCVYILWFT